jgi:hypothetical protein
MTFSHEDSETRRRYTKLKFLEKHYKLSVLVPWWLNDYGGRK